MKTIAKAPDLGPELVQPADPKPVDRRDRPPFEVELVQPDAPTRSDWSMTIGPVVVKGPRVSTPSSSRTFAVQYDPSDPAAGRR